MRLVNLFLPSVLAIPPSSSVIDADEKVQIAHRMRPRAKEKRVKRFENMIQRADNIISIHSKNINDSGNILPKHFVNCSGIAIGTMYHAGLAVGYTAGDGILLKRLSNGNWSAPSAFG